MRTLGLIAIGGLGIGIASLSLAYALGGRDLHRLPFELASSCGDGAKGGPSVRQLAWGNGDSIELSLPGTVTFRGGQEIDLCFVPQLNHWNGNTTLQLNIKDARLC